MLSVLVIVPPWSVTICFRLSVKRVTSSSSAVGSTMNTTSYCLCVSKINLLETVMSYESKPGCTGFRGLSFLTHHSLLITHYCCNPSLLSKHHLAGWRGALRRFSPKSFQRPLLIRGETRRARNASDRQLDVPV